MWAKSFNDKSSNKFRQSLMKCPSIFHLINILTQSLSEKNFKLDFAQFKLIDDKFQSAIFTQSTDHQLIWVSDEFAWAVNGEKLNLSHMLMRNKWETLNKRLLAIKYS